MFDEKFLKRFWSKVKIKSPDECWEWQAHKIHSGYGYISIGPRKSYRNVRAHRISWQIANKKQIPNGICVLHHCDNPSCVNPSHLYLGTLQDNSNDRVDRKRASKLLNGTVKISREQAGEIRARYKTDNVSQQELANEYGTLRGSIRSILRRKY